MQTGRVQTGQVQGQPQTVSVHEADTQDELSLLGFRLACRSMEFNMPGITARDLTTVTSPRQLQRLCDRIQESWPPKENGKSSLVDLQIGQLGLLFSENRVPNPQRLIETLIEIDEGDECEAQAFISCFVRYGIRVSVPAEEWDALEAASLSNHSLLWARVIFHPEGEDKQKEYRQSCHKLIEQSGSYFVDHEIRSELIKYWAAQGMHSQGLIELLTSTVSATEYHCPWGKLFSTFHDTDSFWQILRDGNPGCFDDINKVMASQLPDGRSFFMALWQAFKGKCLGFSGHNGLFSHLESLGVSLNTEISPGRSLLDELAASFPVCGENRAKFQSQCAQLFSRIVKEGAGNEIVPLVFARITKSMDGEQRVSLLIDLLDSKRLDIRWFGLFDRSGQLLPEWRNVMPNRIKTTSDLLAQRRRDGTLVFMSFWEQSRREALHWLFDLSGTTATAIAGKNVLEPLVKQLLSEGDSTGLHEIAQSLERFGPEELPLPDACRRNLFRILLTAAKDKPGGEHTLGGSMRLLRIFAASHRHCLREVSKLSNIAWQNLFGGNTPVPNHLAAIALEKGRMFQESLKDLNSYFPERISQFSIVDDVGGVDKRIWEMITSPFLSVTEPEIPSRLHHKGGSRRVPANSMLVVDSHGMPGILAGYLAADLAGSVGVMLKKHCKTLPGCILLESCLSARSEGGKSLSTAEQFARSWYRQTRKPVSVLAYEGLVSGGGLFHPKRQVVHEITGDYDFRPRHSRELLVRVSAAGRMKKTWRSLPVGRHSPRRLQFS